MKKKPYGFTATAKPFTVQLDMPCAVTGYTEGNKYASFWKPVSVKKGDTFRVAPGGIILNDVFVKKPARPLREMVWKVSWVAKRLRVAVFQERDLIWNRRTRKPTKRFGKPYWVACDLRSYHLGTGKDVVEAVRGLIMQVQATNLGAEEEKAKGHSVIRWRCLLPPKEAREMEAKARKTGFILDGVEVPPLPEVWQRGLERMRRKAK